VLSVSMTLQLLYFKFACLFGIILLYTKFPSFFRLILLVLNPYDRIYKEKFVMLDNIQAKV
jgi:hypothetical protein